MATDLAKLVVKLEAQTAQYQKQLERAQMQNKKFAARTKSSLADIKAGYIAMAGAAAGAFAAIKSGIERGANLIIRGPGERLAPHQHAECDDQHR